MAGYHTIEALRPILHRGPPAAPVVDRALITKRWVSKAGTRLPDDVVSSIRARREAGESTRSIGKALGVSHFSIVRHTKDIPPPNGKWRTGWETGARAKQVYRVEFAKRLRRSGFTFDEIAAEVGCSRTQASYLIRGRHKSLGKRTPLGRLVRAVSLATGAKCGALRRDLDEIGGRTDVAVAKARHIAFWLARRQGMSFPAIARSLGGYDHTTIMNGCRRVDAVISDHGVNVEGTIGRVAGRLWRADWPASSEAVS